MRWSCILLVMTLLAGCHSNGLVSDLRTRGVRPENTCKLRFVGSPADFGDLSVETTDPDIIRAVWCKILHSSPYGLWCACGDHTIEFFVGAQDAMPAAGMGIKETDLAYVRGAGRWRYDAASRTMVGGYQCIGLNDLVSQYIFAEVYRRGCQKRSGEPSSRPAP